MMGTGPYSWTASPPARASRCRRYDGYHGAKPAFDGHRVHRLQDGATRAVSLQPGQGRPHHRGAVPRPDAMRRDRRRSAARSWRRAARRPDLRADRPGAVQRRQLPQGRRRVHGPRRRRADRCSAARPPSGRARSGRPSSAGTRPRRLRRRTGLRPGRDACWPRRRPTRRDFTHHDRHQPDRPRTSHRCSPPAGPRSASRCSIEQLAGGPWSIEVAVARLRDADEPVPERLHLRSRQLPHAGAGRLDEPPVLRLHRTPRSTAIDTVWQTSDDAERKDALSRITRILAEDTVIFPPVYPRLAVAQRVELSPVDREPLRISRIRPADPALRD